jgi:hypothetical protein
VSIICGSFVIASLYPLFPSSTPLDIARLPLPLLSCLCVWEELCLSHRRTFVVASLIAHTTFPNVRLPHPFSSLSPFPLPSVPSTPLSLDQSEKSRLPRLVRAQLRLPLCGFRALLDLPCYCLFNWSNHCSQPRH